MAALSACQLSRLLPEKDKGNGAQHSTYRPSPVHQLFGQSSYGTAMRRMALWCPKISSDEIELALTIMTLFCFLESTLGNFAAFDVHSKGVAKLLEAHQKSSADSNGYLANLCAVWVKCKTQNWWLRFHFSTPQFQRDLAPLHLSSQCRYVLNDVENRRASVLLSLCESYRLSNQCVLACWDAAQTNSVYNYVLQEDLASWTKRDDLNTVTASSCAPYLEALRKQGERLRQWHSRLPGSELSIEVVRQHPLEEAQSCDGNTLKPLYFTSHAAAMNYAYYIAARIIQSSDIFPDVGLQSHLADQADSDNTSLLIWLLVRLVAGLDWSQCTKLNTYSIGISSLLPVCIMRSHSDAAGLWLQEWLEQRSREGSLEEGSFPVAQCLQMISIINQYRESGKDIVAFFHTEDDGGGAGKAESFVSQTIRSVQVYGRHRHTNVLFSEYVDRTV